MLDEKIKELAITRQKLGIVKVDYEQALDYFKQSSDVVDYETAKENVKKLEDEIRTEAVKIFEETQNKNPHPAVKIQENIVFIYKDEEALECAKVRFPDAVIPQSLDKKQFNIFIKGLNEDKMPKCVEKTIKPVVKIDTNLSQYLKEE